MLHVDVLMDSLPHLCLSIRADHRNRLPYRLSIKAHDNDVVAINKHLHVLAEGFIYLPRQHAHIQIGQQLYRVQAYSQSFVNCGHNLIQQIADALIVKLTAEKLEYPPLVNVRIKLHKVNLRIHDVVPLVQVDEPSDTSPCELCTLALDRGIAVKVIRLLQGRIYHLH